MPGTWVLSQCFNVQYHTYVQHIYIYILFSPFKLLFAWYLQQKEEEKEQNNKLAQALGAFIRYIDGQVQPSSIQSDDVDKSEKGTYTSYFKLT